MPSDQSIAKYREIYRKQFGEEISPEEATSQAQRLLNLARVVIQPMPKLFEKRYKELLKEQTNKTTIQNQQDRSEKFITKNLDPLNDGE